MSFLDKEMSQIIERKEREAPVVWETLTEVNALKTVSKATNLLNANVVKYVRTTPRGGGLNGNTNIRLVPAVVLVPEFNLNQIHELLNIG